MELYMGYHVVILLQNYLNTSGAMLCEAFPGEICFYSVVGRPRPLSDVCTFLSPLDKSASVYIRWSPKYTE